MDAAQATVARRLDAVAGSPEPLVAFCGAAASYVRVIVARHLAAVLGGAWTELSRQAEQRAARIRVAMCQRRDPYDAIGALVPAGPVQERLRADLLRRLQLCAAHLDTAGPDRLGAINTHLAPPKTSFRIYTRSTPRLPSPPTTCPGCRRPIYTHAESRTLCLQTDDPHRRATQG